MKNTSSNGDLSALVVAPKAEDLLRLGPQHPGQAARTIARSIARSDSGAGQVDLPLGEPLNIRQVAQLIGCSVWTVRQRHLPNGLPYLRSRPSGKLTFYRDQVVRWILENQIQERKNSR